ncbi:MAG: LuxR C-terminal-related transcriptional regulator, partial [Myxococcota bacterium]
VNDIGQLQHNLKLHSVVPLIVLDESTAHHLWDNPREILTPFSSSEIALAYRQKQVASQILSNFATQALGKEISAFPLNVQLEVFMAVMKILICGERYVHCELRFNGAYYPGEARAVQSNPRDGLTDRELQVLSLVAEGKQNKVVAHELDLSEHTVKLHMHNVLSKLGLANRTEASAWFHSYDPSIEQGRVG